MLRTPQTMSAGFLRPHAVIAKPVRRLVVVISPIAGDCPKADQRRSRIPSPGGKVARRKPGRMRNGDILKFGRSPIHGAKPNISARIPHQSEIPVAGISDSFSPGEAIGAPTPEGFASTYCYCATSPQTGCGNLPNRRRLPKSGSAAKPHPFPRGEGGPAKAGSDEERRYLKVWKKSDTRSKTKHFRPHSTSVRNTRSGYF